VKADSSSVGWYSSSVETKIGQSDKTSVKLHINYNITETGSRKKKAIDKC